MLDLDTCLKYLKEEHYCPHCNTRLSCCQAPPFHVGDGLGWGTEVLFVCLNDECKLFANSWQRFEDTYGHSSSCRYVLVPGEPTGSAMMVQGKDAFTGSVLDPEEIRAQNNRYACEQEALAKLSSCVAEHDCEPVMTLLLDEKAGQAARKQACECLAGVNDMSCIDALRNHKFANHEIEQRVNLAIAELLKANFMKECPYCAEIVKSQAKVCKHCNKELA